MKHLRNLFFLFSLLSAGSVYSQTAGQLVYGKSIEAMYDAYNRQDYEQMRSYFSAPFKVILSKKRIRQVYQMEMERLGKVVGHKITYPSEQSVSAELTYEWDPTEPKRVGYSFSKKGKIQGMNNPSTKFRFPRNEAKSRDAATLVHWQRRIDSIGRAKFELGHFNGCVLVIHEGKTLSKQCYGYSNMETHEPLDENSVFELASCSKQFTAMGIMLLAEQGKLNYEDDITKWLPGLPYKGISIEHLLRHTSGLADYMELCDKYWDKSKIATNADILALFIRHKPKSYFKPGKKYEYSNTGYAFLSSIIEKASGMSYGEFLAAQIFKPLGMNRTSILRRRYQPQKADNYAYGYVRDLEKNAYRLPDSLPDYNYVYWLDGITGDGTVNSTISDLAIWEQALRAHKLASKATLDRAWTNYELPDKTYTNYGYGWGLVLDDNNIPIAEHSGGWPGYATMIIHAIDRPTSIIILSNNEYPNISKYAYRLAKLVLAE